MAWSGGTFTRANGSTEWQDDAALGIGIEAGLHDAQDNDLATGINNCLTKDGQNTPTANLPMGGYKHTGAGSATGTGQYTTYNQLQDSTFAATVASVAINNTSAGTLTQSLFSNDASPTVLAIQKSRGATVGTNTIVANGDALGSIEFRGANGTGYTTAAQIRALVDGAPGATNDMPGALVFYTTPDGSGTVTERMRIDDAGNVGIGRNNPGTYGNLEVGGSAYAATGIVSSSASGAVLVLAANGTSETRINTNTNHPMNFYTNNLNRFTITNAGNLVMNTTSAVFAGDFSNATINSRNAFMSATTNGESYVDIIPNGTATISSVSCHNNSSRTNASYTAITTSSTNSLLVAGKSGTGSYLPLGIYVSGSEILTGTTSGRIGIRNNAPAGTLDVSNVEANNISTAKFVSTVAGDVAQNAVFIGKKDNNSTTSQILVQFAINSAATGSGQINANGASACAFGTFSDERLKENIEDLPSQFNNIMALRPVEFDYKDGSGHQVGFIAQEVYPIYPDLIGTREDGMYTLTDLNKNDARLIKAFQELANMVTDLQTRVTALEGA